MRLLILSLAIIVWLPQGGLNQGRLTEQSTDSDKYRSTSFWEGKIFSTEFSSRDLNNTPSWIPEKGDPPISIGTAVKKSRNFLTNYFPNPDSWKIERITCDQFGKDKWVYVVEFALEKEMSRDDHAASFSVFMKMDGNFFEPKVTLSGKH